jgi:hypothetical protein
MHNSLNRKLRREDILKRWRLRRRGSLRRWRVKWLESNRTESIEMRKRREQDSKSLIRDIGKRRSGIRTILLNHRWRNKSMIMKGRNSITGKSMRNRFSRRERSRH